LLLARMLTPLDWDAAVQSGSLPLAFRPARRPRSRGDER
jgi:hypothetical protein